MKTNLAVVFGSRTCEHDVSIISGLQAAMAADSARYDVTRVYISREGDWYIGEKLADMTFYLSFDPAQVTHVLTVAEKGKLLLIDYPTEKKKLFGGGRCVEKTIDVVLPVMHGLNGEDGTLQGMLELMNVPFASSGTLGCAVGMDKIAMKQLFRGCGFPVLPDTWAERGEWERDRNTVVARCEQALSYPMFVKPANLGSSIGISRANDRDGLVHALEVAFSYDRRVLIEKAVTAIEEVNCSALGYAEDVRVSETEMPVRWDDKELLDFSEKYLRGNSGKGMSSLKRKIPAPVDDEKQTFIRQTTADVFRALDCKGVTRVDYIIDKDEDRVYLGEVNTIPGSLAFYLWEPVGVSFAQLIDAMVDAAFKAWADRNKSVFSYDSNILASVRSGAKAAKVGR